MQFFNDIEPKDIDDYINNKENKNDEYGIKKDSYKADKTNKPGYPNNFDEEASLQRLLRANGIYRRSDFDDFNSFYIFPRNDPYKMFGTTREYVFITKPDLHIFGDTNSNYNGGVAKNIKDTSKKIWQIRFYKKLSSNEKGK